MSLDKIIPNSLSKKCDCCGWELALNFFNTTPDGLYTHGTCRGCYYDNVKKKYPWERYIKDNEGNR